MEVASKLFSDNHLLEITGVDNKQVMILNLSFLPSTFVRPTTITYCHLLPISAAVGQCGRILQPPYQISPFSTAQPKAILLIILLRTPATHRAKRGKQRNVINSKATLNPPVTR